MLYVAAFAGLYNYILFRWMLPMVPASVMVTGHPRGKGRRWDFKMQFYCVGIFFFFKYLVLFIQEDLRAFSMCELAVLCSFMREVGKKQYHPILQM